MNTDMNLVKSDVIFDEMAHTYTTPNGRQLSGITSMLSRQLFADKYDGIPEDVLRRAAEYGSNVHERIELHDALGTETDDPIITEYERLKAERGLTTVANEYLVSDGEHVASSIDIVFDGPDLCDTKTTSKLDREYLSWQLSCYAYLFERQNPGLKVRRLFALWLPKPQYGQPAMVEVERKPDSEIAALIAADKAGEQFVPSTAPAVMEDKLAIPQQAIDEVVGIERELKALKAKKEALQAGFMELMQQAGLKSWKCDSLSLTVKAASVRTTIDAKKLKEEYPAVYDACVQTTQVKESLTIKVS